MQSTDYFPKEDEPCCLVIPAAGIGKRMRSVNPRMPKELLPVGNKPSIQYAVEEGLSAGIKYIVIIISRQKEIIRRYFEDKTFRRYVFPHAADTMEKIDNECAIVFRYQDEPRGESDAIHLVRDVIGDNALFVVCPDNIYLPTPGALKALKAVFLQYGVDVTALMELRKYNAFRVSHSGRVDVQPMAENVYCIVCLHPKGQGHFIPRFERELRACGMYVSGSHLFDYIERAREKVKDGEFTDTPVRALIMKERGLLGCLLPGSLFDIGNPKGYEICLQKINTSTFSAEFFHNRGTTEQQ
ncbi:MAG: sugar phosphate nucleotidyltransferase [Thermodesulfobacteriota bacterium]|nr:sugar phosphate nucleotidyltransferase [Thermodesulfobacteriota bacterium]